MDWIDFRNVGRNALALYLSRFALFVVPLITIPFLARVLRPDALGALIFAQTFGIWLTLVVGYGFEISATRDIARRRDDRDVIAETAAGVISAQFLLVLASAVIAAGVTLAVPMLRADPLLGLLAWVFGTAQGLFPRWYYLGMERMGLPAALDVVSRMLALAFILLLVDGPEDVWLVLTIYASAAVLEMIVGFTLVYRRIAGARPRLKGAVRALRSGSGMFLFVAADSLFTTANAFILGLFAPITQVGFFGAAERISGAAQRLAEPISQALFPFQSELVSRDQDKARRVARVTLYLMGVGGLVGGILLAALAPWIVSLLLGPGYEAAVPVLRVLALLLPLGAVGNVLGFQWMLPLGLDRPFNAIIITTGILNICLAVYLAPRFGALGMSIAVVCAEVFVTLAMFIVLVRRGLNPLSSKGATT